MICEGILSLSGKTDLANRIFPEESRMQLKTILNRVAPNKGFVFGAIRFVDTAARPAIEVELRARANSEGQCSGCGRKCPGYDTLAPRRFEFIPFG
jgi:hypothetical protein